MRIHALPQVRTERPGSGGIAQFVRRVRVWWNVTDLDRLLAEGTHPSRSRELSLRASQLTTRDQRLRFAGALERAVADARAGPGNRNFAIPLQRAAIVSGEDELLALAAALRSPAGCRPHAAALVSFLVCDGRSPLYDSQAPAAPGNLARAATAGFETPPSANENGQDRSAP
jgi:hypothetical protein